MKLLVSAGNRFDTACDIVPADFHRPRITRGSVRTSFALQEGDELVGLHCFRRLEEELDTAVESVNT
jgi:hypothetical protein